MTNFKSQKYYFFIKNFFFSLKSVNFQNNFTIFQLISYNFYINLNILAYILPIFLNTIKVQTNKISIRLTPNLSKLISKIEFNFKKSNF